MHDIKWIREHPGAFDCALRRRGLPDAARNLVAIDERRRHAITKLETAQARRNAASKEIGQAKARGDATAQTLMAEVAHLKSSLPGLELEVENADEELSEELSQIPNLLRDDVPDGADSSANVEHHRFGTKPDHAFTPKQHFELGEALGMMDFEAAVKL